MTSTSKRGRWAGRSHAVSLRAMARRDRVDRMTPDEARAYWHAHEQRFAGIDWERDPDGLSGYLGPGQPAWLNRRYAAWQQGAFDRLLTHVPAPAAGAAALDVGCGAGRWTRRLAQRGYAAVGIDVQAGIIAVNRERFPDIEWHAVALQELPEERCFSVITAVGVLEAIPHVEQPDVVRRLAAVLAPGGHVVLLAALDHPSANAYPHDAAGWEQLFAGAGLVPVERIAFGWEPLRRTAAAVVGRAAPSRRLTPRLPTEAPPVDPADPGGAVWRAPRALRLVAAVDDRLEPLLHRVRPPGVRTRWAAFLFRRG